MTGKGEGGGGGGGGRRRLGLRAGAKVQNTPVSSSAAAVERFFSESRIFFVDDDSGLSAVRPQNIQFLKFDIFIKQKV